MQVEWYGQSAFRLAAGDTTVFIDPFGDLSPMAERGMQRFKKVPPLPVFLQRAWARHRGMIRQNLR